MADTDTKLTATTETVASTVPSQSSSTTTTTIATSSMTESQISDLITTILSRQTNTENESWIKSYWRPAMGWLYMLICLADFVIFPVFAMILPVIFAGFSVPLTYTPWVSLTLSNGGLIHMAFGAILGVAAWRRTSERIAGVS